MRNDIKTKIGKIIALVETLPYFTLDDLLSVEKNKNYLKVLFSRQEKSGKIIRLKKGIYVTERYFLKHLSFAEKDFYYEFLANFFSKPSYLSLDYILYQHNLLTEIPVNFTSITKNKTAHFSNKFGNFFYHKIKDKLFCGFELVKKGSFTILRASKSKALFDFLYLRKNLLVNKETFDELRINLENLTKKELNELEKYIKLEASKKMKEIFNFFKK
jgi:predicted transcriptional regulator of viral defense system